jgi:hypothetical protein
MNAMKKETNNLASMINIDFDKIKPKWSVAQPKPTMKKEFNTQMTTLQPQTAKSFQRAPQKSVYESKTRPTMGGAMNYYD